MTTKQCKEMGYEDDFTTPQEKQLGRIMHDDHRSDFYIVRRATISGLWAELLGWSQGMFVRAGRQVSADRAAVLHDAGPQRPEALQLIRAQNPTPETA